MIRYRRGGIAWPIAARFKWLAALPVAALVIWLLARGLAALLAVDRGLDMTDEGLYLLAADPPSLRAAALFPWGWHTAPLFELAGYDIAAFRTLGAVLLVLAGAWLGWAAAAVLGDAHRTTASQGGASTSDRVHIGYAVRAIGAVVGGIGSLAYYQQLLRTPSYNWLNLLGILIAAGGLLLLIRAVEEEDGWPGRSPRILLLIVASAFGLFLTIPAKPTTVPFLLALGAGVLFLLRGWKLALGTTVLLSVAVAAWMAVAVLCGFWPVDFLRVFVVVANAPADPAHTIPSAFGDLVASVRVFLGQVRNLPRRLIVLFALAIALVVAGSLRPAWRGLSSAGFLLVVLGALVVASVPLPGVPNAPLIWFAYTPISTAAVIVVVGAVLTLLATGAIGRDPRDRLDFRVLAVILYLCALPLVFAFGTTNGTFAQSSLAAGIYFVAATTALTSARVSGIARWAPLVALVVFTGAVSATTVRDGWLFPYRMTPIQSQIIETPIGDHGAMLRLDPALSASLALLTKEARSAGFRPGTPLLGVTWPWSTTLPYTLGARVPDSLVLTVFGGSGAEAGAEYNLSNWFAGFPSADAWIATTASSALDASARASVARVLQSFSRLSGRSFPSDYVCVAAVGEYRIWRPASTADETTGSMRPGPGCGDESP
jgi:hypothetical protein